MQKKARKRAIPWPTCCVPCPTLKTWCTSRTSLHFNNIARLESQNFGSILKLLTNLMSWPFSGLFGPKKSSLPPRMPRKLYRWAWQSHMAMSPHTKCLNPFLDLFGAAVALATVESPDVNRDDSCHFPLHVYLKPWHPCIPLPQTHYFVSTIEH